MVKQVCCDTMHSIPVLPSHMQKKLLPLSRSCERFRGQTLVVPAQPSPPGLLSPPQGAAGQSPAGIRCGGALSPLGTYGAGRGSNGARGRQAAVWGSMAWWWACGAAVPLPGDGWRHSGASSTRGGAGVPTARSGAGGLSAGRGCGQHGQHGEKG